MLCLFQLLTHPLKHYFSQFKIFGTIIRIHRIITGISYIVRRHCRTVILSSEFLQGNFIHYNVLSEFIMKTLHFFSQKLRWFLISKTKIKQASKYRQQQDQNDPADLKFRIQIFRNHI